MRLALMARQPVSKELRRQLQPLIPAFTPSVKGGARKLTVSDEAALNGILFVLQTGSLFEITRPSSYTDLVTNLFSFGAERRNRGIEWGLWGSPLRGVRMMGRIVYTAHKLTQTAGGVNQGKVATGVPQLQGTLGVEWDVPAIAGLTVTGNATAVSKQYIDADNSLWAAGCVTYDHGARYATMVAGNPVTFRATVLNVSNKAYWGMPLLSSLALGVPRTPALSATIDF